MDPTTRYTLRRNAASIIKKLILIWLILLIRCYQLARNQIFVSFADFTDFITIRKIYERSHSLFPSPEYPGLQIQRKVCPRSRWQWAFLSHARDSSQGFFSAKKKEKKNENWTVHTFFIRTCKEGCRNPGGWGGYIPPIIWLYPPQ